MIAVRVYGTVPDCPALKAALQEHLGEVTLARGSYAEDSRDDAVVQSDLLLCYIDGASGPDAANFVGRVIAHHGVWIYLPVVVVGLPAEVKEQQFLYRLGATLYLPETLGPAYIAGHAEKVLQRTWWHGESQLELPVFVVDRDGTILRANAWARKRFGEVLIGRPYAGAVEESEDVLPRDHPIRLALAGPRVIGSDHKVRRAGGEDRYFLHCSPILTAHRRPGSVSVLMLDMSRWEKLLSAPAQLLQADDGGGLSEKIVRLGQDLGFRRVRLYRYLEEEKAFKGLASVGYGPEKARWFADVFKIPLAADEPSRRTATRPLPCLYVQRPPYKGAETDLVHHFTGPANFAEQLDKERVQRWIEAPVWLTTAAGPRLWGKFSVDPGPDSDQLNERDVGDMALFCRVVGEAITALMRRETEGDIQDEIRASSQELVRAVQVGGDLLPAVVDRVLRLYLKVTAADAVLYRQSDPHSPNTLRLIPAPVFASATLAREWAVPEVIARDALGKYFRFFQGPTPETLPYIVPDAHDACMRLLEAMPPPLKEKEAAFLRSIHAEMYIPVFQGTRVTGMIVAVSASDKAFREELRPIVERLMHEVSIWLELARRHDGQRWGETVLSKAVKVLPALAAVPPDRDNHFFAGLAALLSAHCGLWWNRVFIYSCVCKAPASAELVYAIGGLAGDGYQKDHRTLQKALEDDLRFRELETLVQYRLDHPAPIWRSQDGRTVLEDRLYQACVEQPRKADDSIREAYGDHLPDEQPPPPDEPTVGAGPRMDGAHPLRWLLSQEYTNAPTFPVPMTIPFNQEGTPSRWVRQMNDRYPGMFAEGKTIYAFPLWCASNPSRAPLGIVLLDMQHYNEKRLEDMIAATRVVLGLAGDLLASRYWRRRLRGHHNALREILHGENLKTLWDDFNAEAETLFADLSALGTARPSDPDRILSEVVNRFRDRPKNLERLCALRQAIQEKMDRLDRADVIIEDLGECLRDILEGCRNRYPNRLVVTLQDNGKDADDVALPCDELVLSDAIFALVENSIEARIGEKAQVHVQVTTKPSHCPFFHKMVRIEVRDEGRGVPDEVRPYLFLEGFTSARDHSKGKGLSTVRVQLNGFNGDVQHLVTPNISGATFVIWFGIPNRYAPTPTGAGHEQTLGVR